MRSSMSLSAKAQLRASTLRSSAAFVNPVKTASARPPGLTTSQYNELLEKWGPNEIPVVEKSIFVLFLEQFMGTMPFILEVRQRRSKKKDRVFQTCL